LAEQLVGGAVLPIQAQELRAVLVRINGLGSFAGVLAGNLPQIPHRDQQVGEQVAVVAVLAVVTTVEGFQPAQGRSDGPAQGLGKGRVVGYRVELIEAVNKLGGGISITVVFAVVARCVWIEMDDVGEVARVPGGQGPPGARVHFVAVLPAGRAGILLGGNDAQPLLQVFNHARGEQMRGTDGGHDRIGHIDESLIGVEQPATRVNQVSQNEVGEEIDKFEARHGQRVNGGHGLELGDALCPNRLPTAGRVGADSAIQHQRADIEVLDRLSLGHQGHPAVAPAGEELSIQRFRREVLVKGQVVAAPRQQGLIGVDVDRIATGALRPADDFICAGVRHARVGQAAEFDRVGIVHHGFQV
jgi:hypothetical protein